MRSNRIHKAGSFTIRDSHEGELALEFFEAHLKNRNVIVYSSTSAYKFETQNEGQSSEFFFLVFFDIFGTCE